jgi:hypothetical protein
MENVGIFLWSFGIPMLWLFGNVVVIWYIFPRFGILCQEKSGNPVIMTSEGMKKKT